MAPGAGGINQLYALNDCWKIRRIEFTKPIPVYVFASGFIAWPKRVAVHLDMAKAEKSRSDRKIITDDSD